MGAVRVPRARSGLRTTMESSHDPGFPPTAWTALGRIAAGGDEAREALESLGRTYWMPVYVYLRRKGRPEADAADLTQSFFIHLLEKDLLTRPDASKGRFRGWLKAVLEHFLANQARIDSARKRGGGRKAVSLDVEDGERAVLAGSTLGPEEAFDRVWALAVLDRALGRLDREYAAAGKPEVLAVMRARFGLAGGSGEMPRVDDVTMFRARRRLRALILDEVRDGVSVEEEAEAEVAELFRALGGN